MKEKSASKKNLSWKRFLTLDFLSGRFLYVLVFLTVILIEILLYAVYSIYPFGENAYLRMDCYHQYAPFLKEFYTRMHNGSGLFFAWENGLGVNYWAHYAYYLSSPVNLLTLLGSKNHFIEAIEAGMIIKGGLSAVSFLYYLNHRFGNKNIYRAVFAVFYALSAYFLAYSCNVMWTDCYILFPVILLGVEKIAKGEKSYTYGIGLLLCIWSNFYISVIAGIAIVLYFIACMIIHAREGRFLLKLTRFVLTTVVVCMMMGVILLPMFLCLKNTSAGSSAFPSEWESYFPFHELLARLLVNTNTIQRDSELPNLYASIPALLLLPLYFCNKEIKLSQKITKGILVVFLLFSFQWNVLTYIWHGLHFPNSFPGRHSFFFIFLLISMAYECFEKRTGLKKAPVIADMAVLSLGTGVLWFFLSKDDWINALTTYACSVLFVLLYGLLILLEKNMHKYLFMGMFFTFTLIECICNTLTTGMNSTVDRADYLRGDEIKAETLSYIRSKDDGFYRIEDINKKFMNGAAWDGYYGASYFSSTVSGGVMDFYDAMGMRYSDVAYSFQGGTPFMASFLGIKYCISDISQSPGLSFYGEEIQNDDTGEVMYVYENKYPLSVAFGLPAEVDENYGVAESKRPFENMEKLADNILKYGRDDDEIKIRTVGDEELLFKMLPVYEKTDASDYLDDSFKKSELKGKVTCYKVPAGEHPFFYVVNYVDSIKIITQNLKGETLEKHTESDLKFRHIIDEGVCDEDRILVFICVDDPKEELSFHAYCMQTDVYEDVMDVLSKDQLQVTEYDDGMLKGHITCTKDEILLFTIPYDGGFTVWVDGEKVQTGSVFKAFLGVNISAGEHEVEIRYTPPGFKEGLIISFIGVLLAAATIGFPLGKKLANKRKD